MENNMSVIQVNEERGFVDKAQEMEAKIDESAKKKKKVIKIAGTVATVALIFIPADGPFGELCTVLATPALCALVDVSADIQKKMQITGKRTVEKYVLHVDGTNKNVTGLSLDKDELVKDFTNLKEAVNDFEGGLSKW